MANEKLDKWYVDFGGEYKLVILAKDAKDACIRTLKRYLSKQNDSTESISTLSVPEKFNVNQKGFNWSNAGDNIEFSFDEIDKALNYPF